MYRSKKTFETPELPEATKKTEEMDKKMELKLQKSREREEKAKEKLRQKSLKKRSSRGFFGLFGGQLIFSTVYLPNISISSHVRDVEGASMPCNISWPSVFGCLRHKRHMPTHASKAWHA